MTTAQAQEEIRNLQRSLNYNGEGDVVCNHDDLDDDDDDFGDENDDAVDHRDNNELKVDRTVGFRHRPGVYVAYEDLMRYPAEIRAMRFTERLYRKAVRLLTFPKKKDPERATTQQIRIPPRRQPKHGSLVQGVSLSPNGFIDTCASWLHRASFMSVILILVLTYMVFIFFFESILFGLIVLNYNAFDFECCAGFDYDSPMTTRNFEVVFELSWTTFSTVGYGTVGVPADQDCQMVSYTLAIEAFIGILFSSICGAVFFAKIVRLHTQAHVTFSSAACLQFGDGVTDPLLDIVRKEKRYAEIFEMLANDDIVNYPVLEMRCVNDRAKYGGGEIIDAKLSCAVSAIEEAEQDEDDEGRYTNFLRDNGHPGDDDDCQTGTVMKRTFSDFKVTPDTHPYLSKGVWYFRHTLNHESPLLKKEVTQRIDELGGWPVDLDSPAKIRDCFSENVEEIIVSFRGMSSLTADHVFLKQIYHLSDIYIGWKFAGLVYLVNNGDSSHAGVDLDPSLIHDIVPGLGESHEPLESRGLGFGTQNSEVNEDR